MPGLILFNARRRLPWGLAYIGRNLKTDEPWSSRNPVVVGSFVEFAAFNGDIDAWLLHKLEEQNGRD
jgi:hypothetical protein